MSGEYEMERPHGNGVYLGPRGGGGVMEALSVR